MADIFLSYARTDQAKVEKLAAALEDAGYSVWWDQHLRTGARFSADIETALAEASHALVCWSSNSVRSRWVCDEASEAADKEKLLAVTLDGTMPPMGFRQFHTTDMSGWNGGALPPALIEALGGEPSTTATVASTAGSGSKLPLLAAVGAILLAIAAGAWWTLDGPSKDGAATVAAASEEDSKSVAVMPFRDLSPDKDQQWFSDGLAEEITTALSRVPDLYVAASADAFALRDDELATNEIGDRLRVGHVLGGSIRRAGDDLRITVELVRTQDGERIWSQSYDRSTDDAIAVQEDIASEVARVLDTALDPEALAEMIQSGTKSITAYETAMRAGGVWGFTLEDQSAALDLLAEAHRLDPQWVAPLLADAGYRYYRMTVGTYGFIDKETALEDAPVFEGKIEQILRITKDSDVSAHRIARQEALALRDVYHLRFDDARDRYRELVRRFPKDAGLWAELGLKAQAIGDWDTVMESAAKRYELQGPRGEIIHTYEHFGDWGRGVEISRRAISEDFDTHAVLRAGALLAKAGYPDEAMQAYRMLQNRDDLPFSSETIRMYSYCQQGDLDALRSLAREHPDLATRIAFLLTGDRAKDEELAIYDRSEPPFMLAGWGHDPMRDMTLFPRTRAALERAGVPHGQPLRNRFRCPGGYQGG